MDAIRFGSHIRLKDVAPSFLELNQVDDELTPGHPLVKTDFSQRALDGKEVRVMESADDQDIVWQTSTADGDYYHRTEELTALLETLNSMAALSELGLDQKDQLKKMAVNVQESVVNHEKAETGILGTSPFKTELVFDSEA